MDHVVDNIWLPQGPGIERAHILQHAATPEGLDVLRWRTVPGGRMALDTGQGHVLSLSKGTAQLVLEAETLSLSLGSHVYLPAGMRAHLQLSPHAELVQLQTATPKQAVGTELRVRHDRFLSACAEQGQALRWILTPQYLSRRVFLHHDAPLRSRSGRPVSWFHTTMFDVAGLARNEDGQPVFRMSYGTRSEFNVCYDVAGDAKVRMAEHPYVAKGQQWGPWLKLHSDATYHLYEAEGGPEEESYVDDAGVRRTLRNRHEVSIEGGYTSLFCLFDPAPTGIEQHRPGEYSDYEPLEDVRKRPDYALHTQALKVFDGMVDSLSMADARGQLQAHQGGEAWALFERGAAEQRRIEAALMHKLKADGAGRDRVLQPWLLSSEL